MKIAAFLSLACASPARAVTTCDVGGLDVSTWKETPCVASSKSLPGSFAGAIDEGPYRVGNAAVECAWMDRCLSIFVSTRSGMFRVGLGCVPAKSEMVKITIPSTGQTYDMTMAEKLWYEKYCSEAPDEYLPVANKHGNVGGTPLLECLARSSWSPTLVLAETYEKDKDRASCQVYDNVADGWGNCPSGASKNDKGVCVKNAGSKRSPWATWAPTLGWASLVLWRMA